MSLILITGGASSGKSSFALDIFKDRNNVTFIATGVITDPEMKERINNHKRYRPKSWETIEEKINLIEAVRNIKEDRRAVVIDCITFWVSNLLYYKKLEKETILKIAEDTAKYLSKIEKESIVVTNEIGMGLIPQTKDTRSFRKIHGEVNQIFARFSNNVFLVVSGIGIRVK